VAPAVRTPRTGHRRVALRCCDAIRRDQRSFRRQLDRRVITIPRRRSCKSRRHRIGDWNRVHRPRTCRDLQRLCDGFAAPFRFDTLRGERTARAWKVADTRSSDAHST
jgi:hypothetical protein